MDSINAAQREKEATRQRAEAQRIQIETQAAAEAEKTRLQGEGQANYRREIANGIVGSKIKSLQAVGMNVSDVNNVVLFNQYLDTMRNLASSQNAKTVVLPASTPGGFNEMRRSGHRRHGGGQVRPVSCRRVRVCVVVGLKCYWGGSVQS